MQLIYCLYEVFSNLNVEALKVSSLTSHDLDVSSETFWESSVNLLVIEVL